MRRAVANQRAVARVKNDISNIYRDSGEYEAYIVSEAFELEIVGPPEERDGNRVMRNLRSAKI